VGGIVGEWDSGAERSSPSFLDWLEKGGKGGWKKEARLGAFFGSGMMESKQKKISDQMRPKEKEGGPEWRLGQGAPGPEALSFEG